MRLGSVVDAVEALLGSMELDEAGQLDAAVARVLAAKLDEAVLPGVPASVALAVAGIAKELRSVTDAIVARSGAAQEFVAGLFE